MTTLELLKEFKPRQLSNGEIRLMCPHRDKHTDGSGMMSSFLSLEKNLFHCFSCGSKSTAMQLLTTKVGVSFSDAVEIVTFGSFDDNFSSFDEKDVIDIEAREYFTGEILDFRNQPSSFLERGFTKELLSQFRIGSNENEDGKEVITIPLYQGKKLVGVKYRIDEGERQFWYSENFDRSKYIFNEPTDLSKIVLVEGETDVLMSVQNGIKYAGATLGTEMSKEQVIRLSKFKNIFIAYDNDEAGMLATEKAYYKLRSSGANLLFVPYDAQDPGSCLKNKWISGIRNSTDYFEYSLAMVSHFGDKYLNIKNKAKKMLHIA